MLALRSLSPNNYFSVIYNMATALQYVRRYDEATSLLHGTISEATSTLGAEHTMTLSLKKRCALAVLFKKEPGATQEEGDDAIQTLEEVYRTMRRVLGEQHPHTADSRKALSCARATWAARNPKKGG